MPPRRHEPIDSISAMGDMVLEAGVGKRNLDIPADMTLERLMTDPKLGAFNPSPVQRALMRAIDGQPIDDLVTDQQAMFHFGTTQAIDEPARAVLLHTGVRCGKSLFAALDLLRSVLCCSLRRAPEPHEVADPDGLIGVRPGERVRAIIMAPSMDLAKTVYAHISGSMMASDTLRPLVVDKDGKQALPGAEGMRVKRPSDGAIIEIALVAASGGGTNLRSTWLAGVVFDEADFFDSEDAAVNLTDQIRAARPRLLKNSRAWIVSSPFADSGAYHDMFTEAFGNPGRLLAFHSDSRSMNPTLDVEQEAEERAKDPINAAREWDAVPLSANSSQFFPSDAIEKAINKDASRARSLPVLAKVQHYAGTDLGFRKNSSALAISRLENKKVRLAFYEELMPSKGASLKPSEVCKGFGDKCAEYGAKSMRGDLHYVDTAHEELGKRTKAEGYVLYDEWAVTADTKTDVFTEFRRRAQEGVLDLPNDPRLIQQLKGVTARPMPGGRIHIQLPKQGAAHADVLMAVVLACIQVPLEDKKPVRGNVQTFDPETQGVGW